MKINLFCEIFGSVLLLQAFVYGFFDQAGFAGTCGTGLIYGRRRNKPESNEVAL